jgi:hypothetical protein
MIYIVFINEIIKIITNKEHDMARAAKKPEILLVDIIQNEAEYIELKAMIKELEARADAIKGVITDYAKAGGKLHKMAFVTENRTTISKELLTAAGLDITQFSKTATITKLLIKNEEKGTVPKIKFRRIKMENTIVVLFLLYLAFVRWKDWEN